MAKTKEVCFVRKKNFTCLINLSSLDSGYHRWGSDPFDFERCFRSRRHSSSVASPCIVLHSGASDSRICVWIVCSKYHIGTDLLDCAWLDVCRSRTSAWSSDCTRCIRTIAVCVEFCAVPVPGGWCCCGGCGYVAEVWTWSWTPWNRWHTSGPRRLLIRLGPSQLRQTYRRQHPTVGYPARENRIALNQVAAAPWVPSMVRCPVGGGWVRPFRCTFYSAFRSTHPHRSCSPVLPGSYHRGVRFCH